MELRWLLLLFVVNLIYVMIGGICFSYLEYDYNQKSSSRIDIAEKIFHQLPGNETCFTYTQVHVAISAAVVNRRNSQDGHKNSSQESSKWSILNSAFFATTVVTTIGYGHMSPATQGGQLFLIFFALLGIPIMLVFLAYVGVRVSNLTQKLADCMKCFKNHKLNNVIDITVLVFFGITLFIFVPAGIFHHMEDWSFITACYFCVVTLSTIGFGDYVTDSRDTAWYRILVACWIMVGLAWFAGVVSNMQDKFQKQLDHHKGSVSCTPRKKPHMEWIPTSPVESELHVSSADELKQSV